MPELPDLQVFSKNLTTLLKGKKVRDVAVPNSKKLNVSVKELKSALTGQTVQQVDRVGKELHVVFKNKAELGLHLMLRGKLLFAEGKNPAKYVIIELMFTDNTSLAMSDYQGQATPTLNPESRDAPDALSDNIDFQFLKKILEKSKASIKNILLDQKVIRGIGNAYADEILWHARISPFSIANKVPDRKIKTLVSSIKSVLKKAEKHILKSNPEIISGEVRDFMNIHNAKKTESPTGGKILHATSGGRKTYYTEEQELFK